MADSSQKGTWTLTNVRPAARLVNLVRIPSLNACFFFHGTNPYLEHVTMNSIVVKSHKYTLAPTLLLLLVAFVLSPVASAETLLVQAARVLDVKTGRISHDARVLVVDGKIASVNPESIPQQARIVDLGDRTLMPGLIDSHVHLTSSGADFTKQILTENAAEAALRGVESARLTLMAGFTTVRDLAQLIPSTTLIAVALADASEKGWIAAPRIITAGHALSITGGQIDPSMWVGSAEGILEMGPENGIANNVDELIKATRYQIKHGAGFIKIATTGIMSRHGVVGVQQYSEQEIRAVVEEATRHNIRVAAHAVGAQGINAAVRAGVASIEHGWMLDDESLRLMKKNGTYLVPTTALANAISIESPLEMPDLARVVSAGVIIAMGSDASVTRHGDNANEIIAMVELGLTPLQAIQAATINAVGLLGTPDRGRIEPGLLADLIAVDGNPLDDIRTLSNVAFVMKGGKIYKQPE